MDDSSADGELLHEKAESDVSSGQQIQEESTSQSDGFTTSNSYQDHVDPQLPILQANAVYMQDDGQRQVGVQTFTENAHYFQPTSESN
ncbi:hypothetical protein LTR40_013151, partial [Exophiala xenobiotica]